MSAARERTSQQQPADESVGDIKESLNRIEELLHRGHELLYNEEHEEENAVSSVSRNDHTEEEEEMLVPVPALSPSRPAPRHQQPTASATTARPVKTVAQSTAYTRDPEPYRYHSQSRELGRSTATNTAAGASHSRHPRRSLGESENIFESAARARAAGAGKGRGVPAVEEGVDDDTAQDFSLIDLKARIHRELEEYRRNGPLMMRRKSVQREHARRAKLAAKKQQVGPAAAREQAAVAAHHPLRKSATPPASKSRATAPAPRATGTRLSGPVGNNASRPVTCGGAGAFRSTAPPAPRRQTTTTAAARTTGGPARSKTVGASSSPAAVAKSGAARQPFWERLYNDAAIQQEKLDRMREQARVEERKEPCNSQSSLHGPARNHHSNHRASTTINGGGPVRRPTGTTTAAVAARPARTQSRGGAAAPARRVASRPAANGSTSTANGSAYEPLGLGRRKDTAATTTVHERSASTNSHDRLDDSTQIPASVTKLDLRGIRK